MQIRLDDAKQSWSSKGLRLAVWAAAAAVLLAFGDGLFRGPLSIKYGAGDLHTAGMLSMFSTVFYDLRQMADELIFVGIVLFIGAKFFETRTIFTVGFDKADAARMTMKGPDDDNVVWIGHKYGSRLEAESVAAMIQSRLKSDPG